MECGNRLCWALPRLGPPGSVALGVSPCDLGRPCRVTLDALPCDLGHLTMGPWVTLPCDLGRSLPHSWLDGCAGLCGERKGLAQSGPSRRSHGALYTGEGRGRSWSSDQGAARRAPLRVLPGARRLPSRPAGLSPLQASGHLLCSWLLPGCFPSPAWDPGRQGWGLSLLWVPERP